MNKVLKQKVIRVDGLLSAGLGLGAFKLKNALGIHEKFLRKWLIMRQKHMSGFLSSHL